MMKRELTIVLVAATVLTWATGCDSKTPSSTEPKKRDSNTTAGETSASAADSAKSESSESANATSATNSAIEVDTVDVAGYDAAVAEMKGSVVLVDFWATWCLPCMERFPETVAWSDKFGPNGLKVIAVSMDDADSVESVKEFLSEQKADFRHLMSEWGPSSKSFENFNIRGGGVPFYRLYDRQGKLRYEFTGSPDSFENAEGFENIEPRIKELLAEPAAPQ